MSDGLVLYWDRADNLNLINSDAIPHFDDLHPILDIVIELLRAGYDGIAIDEGLLSNGRYFQGINFNFDTQEGAYLAELLRLYDQGFPLPLPDEVLEVIKNKYRVEGEGR